MIHPSGEEIRLLNDECGNNDNFNLIISDDGGNASCPLSNLQTIAPTDALSSLNGLTTDGTWVLEIQDDANQDGGSLNSWGLEICYLESLTSLPVELVDFNAKAAEKQIDLTWETGNEQNNAGFEILRSRFPNRGFEQIGWVDGFGTNNGNFYYYNDFKVEPGIIYYYQLNQVDFDGQSELSKIVSARLKADDLIIGIRPNPVRAELTLSLALEGNHHAKISIIDLLGRKIMASSTEFSNVSEQVFNLNQLVNGVYFLDIEMETGAHLVRKFVKE